MATAEKLRKGLRDPTAAVNYARNKYHSNVRPATFDRIDTRLSAHIYKNFAGFQPNLAGNLAITKAKLGTDSTSIQSRSEGRECKKQGFFEFGQQYDEELINTITEKYENLLDEEEHTVPRQNNDPGNGEVYARQIKQQSLLEHVPEIKELLTDRIKETIRGYYAAHFQIRGVYAYRTHHIPEEILTDTEVYNDHWHADGRTTDHLKLFVCLSDVSEQDGPLHILSRSDTAEIASAMPNFERYRDGTPGGHIDEISDPVTLTGPAGTAMLGNTQLCLHRAGVPDPGHHRDLLQIYIAPASEPLPVNWHENTSNIGQLSLGYFSRLFDY